MRDFFYNGQVRLDWGFGNPNVTGALIALLMLGVWALAYLPGRWGRAGFWAAWAANAVLGVLLVSTFSRGALVALLAGLVVLAVGAARPWLRGRVAAVLLLSMGLLTYAWQVGLPARTAHGLSGGDRSVGNRWLIYKVVPRMMWDAPEGWGQGRGAEAFRQWYQPLGRTEMYGGLVNSHATWLVEWPWHLRLAYGLGWTGVLLLCVPGASMRFSVPLSVWTCFGVGACFTTTAHNWHLWVVPGLLLLVVLAIRLRRRSWPGVLHVSLAAALFGATALGGWVWARAVPSAVELRSGVVTLGVARSRTSVALSGIDETVLGKFYGHRLRERCAAAEININVRWSRSQEPPPLADVWVVAGKVAADISAAEAQVMAAAKRWLLLNPDPPSVPFLQLLERPPSVTLHLGSFENGHGRQFWQAMAARNAGQFKVEEAMGRGRFLPEWSEFAF